MVTTPIPTSNVISANQSFANVHNSYGNSYALVNIHNLQPANFKLFGKQFSASSGYDCSPMIEAKMPPNWGGELSLMTSGITTSGFSSTVQNTILQLRQSISMEIASYPVELDVHNNPKNSQFLRKIVDDVFDAFADKVVFYSGHATHNEIKIDAQRFYNEFQALIKETIINEIIYSHHRLDFNFAWASVFKAWKYKLVEQSRAVTSSKLNEVEIIMQAQGIDYRYFGEKMLIIDNQNTNFLFIANNDLDIKVHAIGPACKTLRDLNLI